MKIVLMSADLRTTKLELSCLHSLHLDADIKSQDNNYEAK